MSYQNALEAMSRGRADPSDYIVLFPSRVSRQYAPRGGIDKYVSYFTRALTLPSTANSMMSLTGQENVGISRNVITGRQFGSPLVMTFSETRDLFVYQTLKNWIDSTVENSSQLNSSRRSLRVNYYDDIKSDLTIFKTEGKRNMRDPAKDMFRGHLVTGRWEMINCIPLGIEQTTMSVEAADSLLDFTASFAYESFRFIPMEQKDLSKVVEEFYPVELETGIRELKNDLFRIRQGGRLE